MIRQMRSSIAGMVERPRRATHRLTVELPIELVEKLVSAAELSHRTVDQFMQDILATELERWDVAFPLPAPPADLQRALDANPAAAALFATISRSSHHAILGRIEEAKRPDTRARRIEQTIAMLLRGETRYRQ
jgi:uncharacterized protein YdeI (YjbR/CyaY-like superfamily)